MMKLVVGFIVGVAMATLGFVQFDAEEVAIQGAGRGDVPALTEAPDSVGIRREAAAPPLNPVAELRAPATSIQVESPTIEELRKRQNATFQAYEAAVASDPEFADAHYNLGLLYESLGRPKEAIRHMARYRVLNGRR